MSAHKNPNGTIGFKTGYCDDAVDRPSDLVARARVALKGVNYDTLVGTGLSGSLVVPVLARALRKNFVIVRKPNDGSHHGETLVGNLGKRWIFVDDFVCSGATKRRVLDAIRDAVAEPKTEWVIDRYVTFTHETEYAGDFLYHAWDMTDPAYPDGVKGLYRPDVDTYEEV